MTSAADRREMLARMIAERRLEIGFATQRDAAASSSITLNTWHRAERGQSVSARSMNAIARTLQWGPSVPASILRGDAPQADAPDHRDLKAVTRALADRIQRLEAEMVAHSRNGDRQQALYDAHTAAYLRSFLAEFIGPLWLTWISEETP